MFLAFGVVMFLAFGVILLGLWGNLFVGLQLRVLFDSPGCFHGSESLSLLFVFCFLFCLSSALGFQARYLILFVCLLVHILEVCSSLFGGREVLSPVAVCVCVFYCFVLSCYDLHVFVCVFCWCSHVFILFWVLSNNFCNMRSTLLGKKCDPRR